MGFISPRKLSQDPAMIHFTCGKNIDEVLIKNRSDIIIVGHDIAQADKPEKQAAIYRERAWKAHVKTIS
jgi:hypothetical protein